MALNHMEKGAGNPPHLKDIFRPRLLDIIWPLQTSYLNQDTPDLKQEGNDWDSPPPHQLLMRVWERGDVLVLVKSSMAGKRKGLLPNTENSDTSIAVLRDKREG